MSNQATESLALYSALLGQSPDGEHMGATGDLGTIDLTVLIGSAVATVLLLVKVLSLGLGDLVLATIVLLVAGYVAAAAVSAARDPAGSADYVDALGVQISGDEAVLAQLLDADATQRAAARIRLSQEAERLRSTFGLLVGPLHLVGVIPLLLALYVLLDKGAGLGWPALLGLGLLLMVYGAAFVGQRALVRLHRATHLLDIAEVMARKR
ncbi:MAG: hypothetical protein AAF184_04540 [Pseudomonadota bacterium]